MIRSFNELMLKVKEKPSRRVVIPGADAKSAIYAATLAKMENIADFLLIGDKAEIKLLIKEIESEMIDVFEIIDETDPDECVKKAVESIHQGKADLILKGKITTSQLMKGVLDKQCGLQTGSILSDVFIFETKERLTLMTDGGIVLYPGVKEKVALINNAVAVAHSLGNPNPKVAILAAVEVVNPKMQPTLDAAVLEQMNDRGQIKGCIVDGPFALDNAISKEAARIKNIKSPVAGDADILIMPNIEAGNIFGKAMTYYAKFSVAHVVMGATAPILITSRADDAWAKLYSIALGIMCVEQ
jgi:phosphate butyryltransferase